MKKKVNTYHVPISVTISAHFTVKARSKAEAIKKARKMYTGYNDLGCTCIDVDFCEDEEDVEEDDNA